MYYCALAVYQPAEFAPRDGCGTAYFSLGGVEYVDLDQNPVTGPILVPAYESVVLIRVDEETDLIFADNFESGNLTANWIVVD